MALSHGPRQRVSARRRGHRGLISATHLALHGSADAAIESVHRRTRTEPHADDWGRIADWPTLSARPSTRAPGRWTSFNRFTAGEQPSRQHLTEHARLRWRGALVHGPSSAVHGPDAAVESCLPAMLNNASVVLRVDRTYSRHVVTEGRSRISAVCAAPTAQVAEIAAAPSITPRARCISSRRAKPHRPALRHRSNVWRPPPWRRLAGYLSGRWLQLLG